MLTDIIDLERKLTDTPKFSDSNENVNIPILINLDTIENPEKIRKSIGDFGPKVKFYQILDQKKKTHRIF